MSSGNGMQAEGMYTSSWGVPADPASYSFLDFERDG